MEVQFLPGTHSQGRFINSLFKKFMMNGWNYGYNNMMRSDYWGGYLGHWATPIGLIGLAIGGLLLAMLVVWSIYWKGRALWRAAHQNSKPWFIALLVINTLGILEILYIYIFSKRKK